MSKSVAVNQIDIYNGARCKSYQWSQNHADLEIKVKLTKSVRYDNIRVTINRNDMKVEVMIDDDLNALVNDRLSNSICLMEGKFEHSVESESSFWLLNPEEQSVVIYIDKLECMWWKQLLLNEEVTSLGPRNYTISMDHLDDGSRMAVDKLIIEQRNRLSNKSGGTCDNNPQQFIT